MNDNVLRNEVPYRQPYGDLTEINSCRLILGSLGKDLLTNIVSDYLDVLGTSAAVYERNGDYALGIFASGWCQLLDRTSRELCRTLDNRKALDSGKWLCHESCWTQASKVAIETRQPVDIECSGGIRLFAVPILVGQEAIGSMNFGYGTPPKRLKKLRQIAEEFGTNVDKLSAYAKEYKPQKSSTIENCKKQLITAARLVGLVVEKKRLQEAAHSSEEWFSTTLRSIGDGVIATDEKTIVKLVNAVAQDLTGWNEKDAIGKPLKDVFNIFNEDSGKLAELPMDRIIREGIVVGLANHTMLIAKDGTKRSIDDSGAPIRDHNGNIIGTILVFRDVSEKRRLERDLTERVKELTCLYNMAQIVERAGGNLDEVYQETVKLMPQGWQYPDVVCIRIIIGGKQYKTENYIKTEWTQSADIKVQGEKVGTIEVNYTEERPARDEGPFLREERFLIDTVAERLGRVTERIQSEKRIKRINNLLLAIRNINQLITREQDIGKLLKDTCDNLVDTASCYHSWALLLDQTMKMTIYGQSGLGDNLSTIRDRARSGDLPICCQKVLMHGELVVTASPQSDCGACPLSQQCANGVSLAANLKYGDNSYGLLCVSMPKETLSDKEVLILFREVADDIGLALRNLETEVERKRVETMKDEFIGLVSHELRTPLTVVISALDTAMDERVSKEDRDELIREAILSAGSLASILDNMLELSRYQAGRLKLEKKAVKIADIAEKAIRRVRHKYDTHDIVLEIAEEIPEMHADAVRIEQVLYNLIENAVKYSPLGSKVQVFSQWDKGGLVVGVCDNGVGIASEDQQKLFEPFARLQATGAQGVGLGLVVCKHLVEVHGGRLWVESQPGKGSTFLFTLP